MGLEESSAGSCEAVRTRIAFFTTENTENTEVNRAGTELTSGKAEKWEAEKWAQVWFVGGGAGYLGRGEIPVAERLGHVRLHFSASIFLPSNSTLTRAQQFSFRTRGEAGFV